MTVLGSRMLEEAKRVGETATAIELRQSGEYSILGGVAFSVSESLTQVLRWFIGGTRPRSSPDDVSDTQVLMQLNTDISTKGLARPGCAGRLSRRWRKRERSSARTRCMSCSAGVEVLPEVDK